MAATRRTIKAINWGALAERIAETDKNALAALKAKSDLYLRRVNENPESQPKIDWAFYKKNVALAGFVDKFQKEYESIKITYPEDKYSGQIDIQEKAVMAGVQKFIQESNIRIEENKEEIKKLEGLMKYKDMTLEDFRNSHPDIALDPLNRPTIWPHTPEYQPSAEDEKPAVHH